MMLRISISTLLPTNKVKLYGTTNGEINVSIKIIAVSYTHLTLPTIA